MPDKCLSTEERKGCGTNEWSSESLARGEGRWGTGGHTDAAHSVVLARGSGGGVGGDGQRGGERDRKRLPLGPRVHDVVCR